MSTQSFITSNAKPSTFIPTSLPQCVLWLDAADITVFNNGVAPSLGTTITAWKDKSSLGTVFSNLTGYGSTSTPTYSNYAGATGIYMSNNTASRQDSLYSTTTIPYYSNATTLFAVYNLTTAGVTASNANLNYIINFGSNVDLALRACTNFANLTNTNDIFNNSIMKINGSACNGYTLPTPTTTFTTNGYMVVAGIVSATSNTAITLSTQSPPQPYARGMNGYLNEIIMYNTLLTTFQWQSVEGYLAWKWGNGLVASLPSTHNYYYNTLGVPFPINVPYNNANIKPGPTFPIPYTGPFQTTTGNRWLPSQLPGLVMWLDASSSANFTFVGGTSNVSGWTNLANPSVSAVQATASNQPTWSNYGGVPALYFNGVNNVMSNATPNFSCGTVGATWITLATNLTPITSNFSDAAVVFATSATGGPERSIRFDPTTSQTIYSIHGGNLRGELGDDANGLRGFIENATTFNTYSNGVNSYSSSTSVTFTTSSNQPFVIGAWNVGWLNGYINEIICINSDISVANYQRLEGYLAWKWGQRGLLPASHPYKLWPVS